jgi:hypothetical protein
MSPDDKLRVILIAMGVVVLVAYVGLVLIPAWRSYSRIWQRAAAAFLSIYILAGCLAIGLVAAYGVVEAWTELKIS